MILNKDTMGWLFQGAMNVGEFIVKNTVGILFNNVVKFI